MVRSTSAPTAPRLAPPTAAAAPRVDLAEVQVRSPFQPDMCEAVTALPPAPPQEATPPSPARLGWKGVAVGVLAAAAVAGAVGVLVGHGSPPPAPESPVASQVVVPANLDAQEAQRSFDDLRFLNTVGLRSGGGLTRPVHGVFSQRVTPQEALDGLAQGRAITFESRAGSVTVRSLDELHAVRARVAQQQIDDVLGPQVAR